MTGESADGSVTAIAGVPISGAGRPEAMATDNSNDQSQTLQ